MKISPSPSCSSSTKGAPLSFRMAEIEVVKGSRPFAAAFLPSPLASLWFASSSGAVDRHSRGVKRRSTSVCERCCPAVAAAVAVASSFAVAVACAAVPGAGLGQTWCLGLGAHALEVADPAGGGRSRRPHPLWRHGLWQASTGEG